MYGEKSESIITGSRTISELNGHRLLFWIKIYSLFIIVSNNETPSLFFDLNR